MGGGPFPIKLSNISVSVGGGLVDVHQWRDRGYDRDGRKIPAENERVLVLNGRYARKLGRALLIAADAADGKPRDDAAQAGEPSRFTVDKPGE